MVLEKQFDADGDALSRSDVGREPTDLAEQRQIPHAPALEPSDGRAATNSIRARDRLFWIALGFFVIAIVCGLVGSVLAQSTFDAANAVSSFTAPPRNVQIAIDSMVWWSIGVGATLLVGCFALVGAATRAEPQRRTKRDTRWICVLAITGPVGGLLIFVVVLTITSWYNVN